MGPNIAQILTTYFFGIVSNLKIAEHANFDPYSENINDPVKFLVKCRNHEGILKIGELCNKQLEFLFLLFTCRLGTNFKRNFKFRLSRYFFRFSSLIRLELPHLSLEA